MVNAYSMVALGAQPAPTTYGLARHIGALLAMEPRKYAGDYQVFAYDADAEPLPEPVAQCRTWREAVVVASRYKSPQLTVAIMRDDHYTLPTTWMRGVRKLARDGFGWVG